MKETESTKQANSKSPVSDAGQQNKAPKRYAGFVEEIRTGLVRGWCYCIDNPDIPVSVRIECDGSTLATVTADNFRADLLSANIGTGEHGFVYETSDAIPDNVVVCPEDTEFPLERLPRTTLAVGNPRRTFRFWLHRRHLQDYVDFGSSVGLEIGAHDLPFVENGEGKCEFADFRTADELHELAAILPGHNPQFVAPVSYNLRDGYDGISNRFDWIASSHVIEHIPDLIWWLNELASLLRSDGIIFFVIPDKRFTFDYHRRLTNFTDVIDAHRLQLRTPSYRHVFDHHFYSVDGIDPGLLWAGSRVPPPPKNVSRAMEVAERALTTFEDAHCSVFTPESFAELINELAVNGLIKLKMHDLRPTQWNQMDFTAILK
jgi:SAM-dependent methyltransferase